MADDRESKRSLQNRIVAEARAHIPEARRRNHEERTADGHSGWVCYPISEVEMAYIAAIAAVLPKRESNDAT